MTEVTLAQMLLAREKRANLQQALLATHHCPLISFSMNIAGPVKTSPLIERAFYTGLEALESKLPTTLIRERHTSISVTGCEAVFSVALDALTLKDICLSIEDSSELGRLFDMDVLNVDGKKLSRNTLRGCIVCGRPGRVCAAGRLHPVSELQESTYRIMYKYFKHHDPDWIASLAVQSLLDEVHTTPKPGLVDCHNSGSHTDMNIQTFIASANSLKSYFRDCVSIGQNTATLPPKETFPLLRQAGLVAEQTMYQVTGGVNTHKGLIYSMGILCGSLGRLWTPETPIANITELLPLSARIVKHSVEKDFSTIGTTTAGGRLYLEYGLTGIRGEVATGFPSVMTIGLPTYENMLDNKLNSNDAGRITLLYLIESVKDTNLYHRGGYEGALFAKNSVHDLLKEFPIPSAKQIEALDNIFIERNLSPGGCADLLAITYFLYSLKKFSLILHKGTKKPPAE